MRITPSLAVHSNSKHRSALNDLLEQESEQKRVRRPSDDPVASRILQHLAREKSMTEQYMKNIDRLNSSLNRQESHANGIKDLLQTIRTDLLTAANDTNAASDLNTLGKQISTALDDLVAQMNSQDEQGHYLFAGNKSDTKPFVYHDQSETYTYAGDAERRATQVADGTSVQENIHLQDVFSSNSSSTSANLELLNEIKKISLNLQDSNVDKASYKDKLGALTDSIPKAIAALASHIGDIGGRGGQLTILRESHEAMQLVNADTTKQVDGFNFANVLMDQAHYQNIINASHKTYMQMAKLSIFNVM